MMDPRRCRPLFLFTGLALVPAALVPGPALAAQGCLSEDGAKVCLEISSDPSPQDGVQPSGFSGGRTFVNYVATLKRVKGTPEDTVHVRFRLTPSVAIEDFRAPPNAQCTKSLGELRCQVDRRLAVDPQTGLLQIGLTVNAPAFAHGLTAPALVNTATFGWDDDDLFGGDGDDDDDSSAEVRHTLPVSGDSLSTFCVKGVPCALSTARVVADASQQATESDKKFLEIKAPAQTFDFTLHIGKNENGFDRTEACSSPGRVFLQPFGDGGPFPCRDNDHPTRWMRVHAGQFGEQSGFADAPAHFDPPLELRFIWDTTLVSILQVDLERYPFAVFYTRADEAGNAIGPVRAFSQGCDAFTPPCIQAVEQFDNGNDWTATFVTSKVDDLEPHSDGFSIDDSPTPKPPMGFFD